MIRLIAAVGKNCELGKNGKLIWHLKEDMKYFKSTTTGCTVVMGRKTYESIGKPLPERENIVVTHSQIEGVKTVSDPAEILNSDAFIIGGGMLYDYFIDKADEIYLTEIEADADADTFFPKFDKTLYKRKVIKEINENGLKYSFVLYKK